MDFPSIRDEEFEQTFMNIMNLSHKDNTYKFAFARFLLEYSKNNTETWIQFSDIARSFLKYYWIQICKSKLRQAPQADKKPEITKIIEKEFDMPYYPHTFKEIKSEESDKIQNCVNEIIKKCFHNVTWRFQKIKFGKSNKEMKIFFDYKINRIINPNKKYVDLNYGINLNPKAIEFFKKYNAVLSKAVTLEWSRFLENLNVGIPKLIAKTEGEIIQRTNLTKYRKLLEPFFKNCFYCENLLICGKKTHVEHVIPFDYIAEDNIWNFVLACQKCNLTKLGSLPPRKFLDKIIERNRIYSVKIPLLEKSLSRLDRDFEKIINEHYENAKSHGYVALVDKFWENKSKS